MTRRLTRPYTVTLTDYEDEVAARRFLADIKKLDAAWPLRQDGRPRFLNLDPACRRLIRAVTRQHGDALSGVTGLYAYTETHRGVDWVILHGEKDERVTLEEARTIASAMGTNARFVAFSGVPHMRIVDARPELWRREVSKFLEQVL